MNYTIQKLDRRHTGVEVFAYWISPINCKSVPEFVAWREWCWENFGPGMELYSLTAWRQYNFDHSKYRWGWLTDYSKLRLYFKDDAALTAFTLRWS